MTKFEPTHAIPYGPQDVLIFDSDVLDTDDDAEWFEATARLRADFPDNIILLISGGLAALETMPKGDLLELMNELLAREGDHQ